MTLICFDLGGTLIYDPFPEALEKLKTECSEGRTKFPFGIDAIEDFFGYWALECQTHKFPFSSNYVQEEIWPLRAAARLIGSHPSVEQAEIPFAAPKLLLRYREIAKSVIKSQPQLPSLRNTLEALKGDKHKIVVASNDREFATSAMLEWAGLKQFTDAVFTSEGLSALQVGAEKPSVIFFSTLRSECARLGFVSSSKIFVGDSEEKDIVPAISDGWLGVLLANKERNSGDMIAQFQSNGYSQLLNILRSAISS